MLQLANRDRNVQPSSPMQRLVQSRAGFFSHGSITSSGVSSTALPSGTANIAGSSPAIKTPENNGIKRDAFSPNYYRRFFVEERELGRGGKGVVVLVRHMLDNVFLGHFACKRVPVGDDHLWLEKVLVEVQLLQRLSHPNLVSYRHVWLEDYRPNRFGPQVPCAFILQQYCNAGDLLHYVIGRGSVQSARDRLRHQLRTRSKGSEQRPADVPKPLAFDEIYSIFRDITSGLAQLHSSGYIHRDLKPSNCLLHREGNAALPRTLVSDFGEVQAENVARRSSGTTGTMSYCAPEVLRRNATEGRYGEFTVKSDIFSLGMILYFLCFARLPYRHSDGLDEEGSGSIDDLDRLRIEISAWPGLRPAHCPHSDLPDQLYGFLQRLLAPNPLDRPTAKEILTATSEGAGLGVLAERRFEGGRGRFEERRDDERFGDERTDDEPLEGVRFGNELGAGSERRFQSPHIQAADGAPVESTPPRRPFLLALPDAQASSAPEADRTSRIARLAGPGFGPRARAGVMSTARYALAGYKAWTVVAALSAGPLDLESSGAGQGQFGVSAPWRPLVALLTLIPAVAATELARGPARLRAAQAWALDATLLALHVLCLASLAGWKARL
jgi:serine/threonine protein kinase